MILHYFTKPQGVMIRSLIFQENLIYADYIQEGHENVFQRNNANFHEVVSCFRLGGVINFLEMCRFTLLKNNRPFRKRFRVNTTRSNLSTKVLLFVFV